MGRGTDMLQYSQNRALTRRRPLTFNPLGALLDAKLSGGAPLSETRRPAKEAW